MRSFIRPGHYFLPGHINVRSFIAGDCARDPKSGPLKNLGSPKQGQPGPVVPHTFIPAPRLCAVTGRLNAWDIINERTYFKKLLLCGVVVQYAVLCAST